MAESISSARKSSRGRPRIDATPVNIRFPPDELSELDAWISRQDEELSRPEAVRRLVKAALSPNTAGASMDVVIKRIRNEIKKKMAEIDAKPKRGG
jgi:DNA-binding response OmpR family regulator